MRKTTLPFIEIFTDGACSGNPGTGGYGAILKSGNKVRELSGSKDMTTNNRMELFAVISALEALRRPCRIKITTDSNYVVKGMTEWVQRWVKNSWKNSQKKEVLNRDLWERLVKASQSHKIEWVWIKGHGGHPENERCDRLARNEIKKFRRQ
jgi:ribonuclease HI